MAKGKTIDTITLEPLPNEENGVSDERRLPVQLFSYWDKIRGDRAFPAEDFINSEDIPQIWEHCFLMQVNDLNNRHGADFTYLGSEILRVYHVILYRPAAAIYHRISGASLRRKNPLCRQGYLLPAVAIRSSFGSACCQ